MAPSQDPARAELDRLAQHAQARITNLNLRFPGAGRPFDQTFRTSRDGFEIEWATNGKMFLIESKASSGVVFSVGKRAEWLLGTVNPTGRIGGSEVFESSRGNFSPRGWLRDPEHAALVKRLCVQRREQLLVTRNGASLLAKPLGFEEDWERAGRLTALLKELPPDQPPVTNSEVIDRIEVDPARLPSDLQPLIPLIRRWATSDDEVRSALLTAASDEELRELRDVPTEPWDLINAYLDENVASDEP